MTIAEAMVRLVANAHERGYDDFLMAVSISSNPYRDGITYENDQTFDLVRAWEEGWTESQTDWKKRRGIEDG